MGFVGTATGEEGAATTTGLGLGGVLPPEVAIARKRRASRLITMTPAATFMAAWGHTRKKRESQQQERGVAAGRGAAPRRRWVSAPGWAEDDLDFLCCLWPMWGADPAQENLVDSSHEHETSARSCASGRATVAAAESFAANPRARQRVVWHRPATVRHRLARAAAGRRNRSRRTSMRGEGCKEEERARHPTR